MRSEAGWALSTRQVGDLVHLGLRWGLALVFVAAGAVKLRDPAAFARAISQYGLVPEWLIPVMAVGLPLAEVLAGVGLLCNRRFSLGAVLALLLLFTAVLGYAVLMDLEVDCGCFTLEETVQRTGVKAALWRDLGLIAACLVLWRWPRPQPTISTE